MRIGELARLTATSVESIRHYERLGLLPPPARSDAGQRRYTDAHLQRLAFVRHCRSLDMPLADIGRLLAVADRPDAACDAVDRLIETQLARVRERIAELQGLERQLDTLREHCATPRSARQCGILHALREAAQPLPPSEDDGTLSTL